MAPGALGPCSPRGVGQHRHSMRALTGMYDAIGHAKRGAFGFVCTCWCVRCCGVGRRAPPCGARGASRRKQPAGGVSKGPPSMCSRHRVRPGSTAKQPLGKKGEALVSLRAKLEMAEPLAAHLPCGFWHPDGRGRQQSVPAAGGHRGIQQPPGGQAGRWEGGRGRAGDAPCPFIRDRTGRGASIAPCATRLARRPAAHPSGQGAALKCSGRGGRCPARGPGC
jgi:hypothetical protein